MKHKTTLKRRFAALPLVLCAVAVAACALAPAAFLAATDAARLGRPTAQSAVYQAAAPTGEDYYLLRQLNARKAQQNRAVDLRNPDIYMAAGTDLSTMTASWEMREQADQLLQALAAQGILPQPWADYATTSWAEDAALYQHQYRMNTAYYSVDTLGFVTIRRYEIAEEELVTVFTLTLDSRTGQVVSLWLSAPQGATPPFEEMTDAEAAARAQQAAEQLAEEYAESGTLTLALDDPAPPCPDAAALQTWLTQTGLDTLGDWQPPQSGYYPNALYSPSGQALISAVVHPYTTNSGAVRWYLSMAITPMAEGELGGG